MYDNKNDYPRPESIDVSHYDTLVTLTAQLKVIEASIVPQMRAGIAKEFSAVASAYFAEWQPRASKDLV